MFGANRRKMQGVRPPAVAGLFYPDERSELCQMIDHFLREVAEAGESEAAAAKAPPKAIIAPHAGYRYSGPIAASAFEPFRLFSERVKRVVLLGPSHRVAFHGLALPGADRFETPLGLVELDLEVAESVLDMPQVRIDSAPHAQEHSLEVEVPFLLRVLGSFRLVPLVVGFASPEEVAEVLERLWGGDETRIVISSDLSHFLDYEAAQRIDRQTAEDIVELRSDLGSKQACGAVPINGMTLTARRKGLEPRLLDLRNSGDTAGGYDQVVGYGAFSFTETQAG